MGGFFVQGGSVLIKDSSANITSNNANIGGGFYVGAGNFAGNEAQRGGGIFADVGSNVAFTGNATFANNSAGDGGGFFASGDAALSGAGFASFTGNIATGKGGGIRANGNVSIVGTGALFADNSAAEGGGIWSQGDVKLEPMAGNTITFATATDNIFINDPAARLAIAGAGVVSFSSTNNHVGQGVFIADGRTELRAASVFQNTPMRLTGGVLYLGNGTYGGEQNRVSGLTVTPKRLNISGSTVGSGATAPYATGLTGFHLGDNAVLALEMNHAGDAAIPYFTLNNGFKATTGNNTTLHGVIGNTLGSSPDFSHTYVVFSGSNGTVDDFTPAHYTTSHLLISLSDPVYDAATGTFALKLQRGNPPPPVDPVPPVPDPVPPVPDPVPPKPEPPVQDDIYVALPDQRLQDEVRQVIVRDYLYNGPGQGTLVGKNTFLDTLYAVKPDGTPLLTNEERTKALASAVYLGVFTGARQIMSETGTRLRSLLFAPKGVLSAGGALASFSGTPADSGGAAQTAGAPPPALQRSGGTLWALPFYNREALRDGPLDDALTADYDLQIYGTAMGGDVIVGNGKYVIGGLLTAGQGTLQAGGSLYNTRNKAHFVGGMLSLRWRPTEALEMGTYAGILHQTNDVTQNSLMDLKTTFDSVLYQGGVNARYELPLGNNGKRVASVDVGADLQRFQQDSLDFMAAGQDVGHMNRASTTSVFVPATLGLRDTFTLGDDSTLTVEGRVGYRLALGDRALRGKWSIPGGQYAVNVRDPESDQHTGTAGFGLKWEKGDLTLSLDYDTEMSRRYRNHMFMGKILWEF